MATSKLLKSTNVTISIPEFTDRPDQRVNSNCIDKMADAVNANSEQIAKLVPVTGVTGFNVIKGGFFRTGTQVTGAVEIQNVSGNSIPANTWTTIGTVDVKPKQASATSSVPAVNTGNGTFAGMILVQTNGNIQIYTPTAIPSNHAVCACVSYETA